MKRTAPGRIFAIGGEARAQFNVAIRTVVVDAPAGTAEYGIGGGITWDSVAESEYDEALVKAAVLTHRPPGFSLLETVRWTPGEGIVRRQRHLDRLRASAHYFGFPLPEDIDGVFDGITAPTEQRVRLVLSPAGEASVEASPLDERTGPVSLAIDPTPVDSRQVLLFHKTTHRALYEAAAARYPEADDVVLVNEHGMATETTRANLAVRFGDRWVTPPLDDGCLPGTYRAELLENGTLEEQSIPVADLAGADDLAVLSSLRGWRPAQLAASN